MSSVDDKELKDLLGKCLEPEQVDQAVEDIRAGERILEKNPAAEPGDAVISRMQAEISRALAQKKAKGGRATAYKFAFAAAAIVIVAIVSVRLLEKGGSEIEKGFVKAVIPDSAWESDDISAADAELGELVAEVEQIESDIFSLRLGEYVGNGDDGADEMEMELTEINGSFWKG